MFSEIVLERSHEDGSLNEHHFVLALRLHDGPDVPPSSWQHTSSLRVQRVEHTSAWLLGAQLTVHYLVKAIAGNTESVALKGGSIIFIQTCVIGRTVRLLQVFSFINKTFSMSFLPVSMYANWPMWEQNYRQNKRAKLYISQIKVSGSGWTLHLRHFVQHN